MRRPALRAWRLAARHVMMALLAGALILPAAALAAQPKVSLTAIEGQYMCTSCGEPLPLAQSPQAQSEKEFLAGLVNRGMTARQIQSVMVASYGTAVLGKPPAQGFNLTVYILPPAVLVAGIIGLVYALPKWRARSRRAAAEPEHSAPALSEADAERLDEDLARFI